MKIGIPKESQAGERRVAATPKTVSQLRGLGYEVVVQSGAGEAASYPDAAYAAEGATIVKGVAVWKADIVTKINAPTRAEIARLHKGSTLISLLAPRLDPDLVASLVAAGVTGMAMDAVPRISRAQGLDVLSSMANISGYRAIIEAPMSSARSSPAR